MVKNLDRLPVPPLDMAKAGMGAALRRAIGNAPLKQFGDEGLMSKVVTGEKVPNYLAKIYEDRAARRRLVKALVADDSGVVVTTTLTFREDDDEEKVG